MSFSYIGLILAVSDVKIQQIIMVNCIDSDV